MLLDFYYMEIKKTCKTQILHFLCEMPLGGNLEHVVFARLLRPDLVDAVELKAHQRQRVFEKARFAAQLAILVVSPRRVFGGEVGEEVELEAGAEPLVQPGDVIAGDGGRVNDVDLRLGLERAAHRSLERDVIRSRQVHHLVAARAAQRVRVDGCDVTEVRGRRVRVVVDEGQVAVARQLG